MQVTDLTFKRLTDSDIRPLAQDILMSFDKAFDTDVTFFELDTSQLNGNDILKPVNDNTIQAWDYYQYKSYRERIVYQSVQRMLDFPYSVVTAIADFQLNNYDGYFTPNSASPIAEYVLPKRPVRLLQGFGNTTLSQFVGLTSGMPSIGKLDGTATFTALDFLTWIYDMPIRETRAMRNVRTDQVLAEIFTQFGLAPEQYNLGVARNRIPFLFFEKDQQTAGDIIRPLMQAEMGLLWLDEKGIIQFRSRLDAQVDPVYIFNDDNIISLETSEDDQIINHVIINTNVRKLQEPQDVYSISFASGEAFTIPANSTEPIRAELVDPAVNILEPVFGVEAGRSWFAAKDENEEPVTSGVTLTGTADQTNSYTLFIQNTNSFPIIISDLVLWGEPAKVVGGRTTTYDAYEDTSVAKYEEKLIIIDNNFIQSISQAESLSTMILRSYSEYNDVLELEVKGTPALQLSDVVTVDYEDYQSDYRVIGISNKLQGGKFTQQLTLRKYEAVEYFTLDSSLLNGDKQLAP